MASSTSSPRAVAAEAELSAAPPLQLPLEFVQFLQDNDLSPAFYAPLLSLAHVPSRFVHPVSRSLDPNQPRVARATKADITRELGIPPPEIHDVAWLPRPNLEFWRLPGHYRVSSPSFRSGAFQALDAGSGVAVHALDVQPDDNVLDLCFAPGGKGALCGEAMRDGRGTVTAVDESEARLSVARSRSRKFGNDSKTRYNRADGTTFDLGAPRLNVHWRAKRFGTGVEAELARDAEEDARWASWQRDPVRAPATNRSKMHSTKRIQAMKADDVFVPYDKVLVDAECTHDGSVSHILKYIRPMTFTSSRPSSPVSEDDDVSPPPSPAVAPAALPASISFPPTFLESLAESRTILPAIQLGLLRNGFRLLKPGGLVVYATCSRAVDQGERLVERFLAEVNADGVRCEVEDIPGRERMPAVARDERFLGGKGLRFSGEYTPGREDEWVSALFVCRLRKIQ